jgi:hypothetical protein
MSWIPSFDTMWGWVFHVPDTYELLWWVLICVCWFGIVQEYRIKKLQSHLDDLTAAKDKADDAPAR